LFATLHFWRCGCAGKDALCRFCKQVLDCLLTCACFPTTNFDRFEQLVDQRVLAGRQAGRQTSRREEIAWRLRVWYGTTGGGW
jgi:hypothetical protein